MKDGFIKVAAASPVIKVADCDYNAERVIECIREADEKGVKLLVFPELTLTGASCWAWSPSSTAGICALTCRRTAWSMRWR